MGLGLEGLNGSVGHAALLEGLKVGVVNAAVLVCTYRIRRGRQNVIK